MRLSKLEMELKQIKRRKVAFSDYAGESDFYKTIFKTIGGDPITVLLFHKNSIYLWNGTQ